MPKLRLDQLNQALHSPKAPLSPVYLITGDEPLLVQEACDAVRKAAKQRGYMERELYHSDASFQWEQLMHSANSISLFAEKKVIEIRVPNGKTGDAGGKAIKDYCASPSEDNLLLLEFPKLDKRTQNSAWFKAIEQTGTIVTIWPITSHQMPHWVSQRLQAAGLSADPQAVEILCEKTEGNLLAAAQEVEKLKLIVEENTHISVQQMASAVTTSARYDVFGLTDKALLGDSRAAVIHLQGLKAEGTEPTIVLWALSREIRALTTMKEGMENGKSFDLVAKSSGIWDNRKPIIKKTLQRLSLSQLYLLINKAGYTDKIIKGQAKGDCWNVLLDMVLSLTGTETIAIRSQRMQFQ